MQIERHALICLCVIGFYVLWLNLSFIIPQPMYMIVGILTSFIMIFSCVYFYKHLTDSSRQLTSQEKQNA